MKTADEVFSYFESFTNLEARPYQASNRTYRLDRMVYLLSLFGDPHKSCKSFHIAGSKGKGSVAALTASALKEAGFVTGLYLSPHISSYRERITVNLEFVADEIILELGKLIRDMVTKINLAEVSDYSYPTTFELLTLLGFLVFREMGCDYTVLETGLGGRLDATNVVCPEVSVITMIEKEHMEWLGDNLEKIAREKAGIIKEGVPVFSSARKPVVKEVLRQKAGERSSEIHFLDEELLLKNISFNKGGTGFTLEEPGGQSTGLHLSLIGSYQAENGALAYMALKKGCPGIRLEQIQRGFSSAVLPGRMEILAAPGGKKNTGSPVFVLDGAHTPGSVEKTLEIFKTLFPGSGILIFGAVKDKEHGRLVEILAPAFEQVIISTPGTFKESDPPALHALFQTFNENCILKEDPRKAFEYAVQSFNGLTGGRDRGAILVTGSFYMVAEIRRFLV